MTQTAKGFMLNVSFRKLYSPLFLLTDHRFLNHRYFYNVFGFLPEKDVLDPDFFGADAPWTSSLGIVEIQVATI